MNTTNSGVDFNFSFAPGTTDEQILGFEFAGEIWSQYLVDTYQGESIDINIHVEVANDLLPDFIVGASFPTIEQTNYRDVSNALFDDVTSSIDVQVSDYLDDLFTIDILVGEEVVRDNFSMHTTTANLKALGLKEGNSQELDGYIIMNGFDDSDISWDYTYLDAPEANELDFLSTALHEIGHTLGFISGLDYSGETHTNLLNRAINYNDLSQDIASFFGYDSNTSSVTETSVMDLFRVSLASQDLGITTLTKGEVASFSFDGKVSNLLMSTGTDYQGSHWVDKNTEDSLGIMNPTLGLGEKWSISENDLSVMDAIGWDVVYPTEINLEELHSTAQSQVESAWIEDRLDAVDLILNTKAYNWSRRSSRTSGGGFWWSSRSSRTSGGGFWQVGYWSTYESDTEESMLETSNVDSAGDSNFKQNYIFWDDKPWYDDSWKKPSWEDSNWDYDSWQKRYKKTKKD